MELKLGRFVGFDADRFMASIDGGVRKDQSMRNSVDSEDVIDSSAILPVRGNVYPDGYVLNLRFLVLYLLSSYTLVESFFLYLWVWMKEV